MSIRRVGIFLALWSFGFACVHVAWALGWRAGVPDSASPISERPVFLTYDLVSGGLMFVAAGVAVSLIREDMSQRVRDLLLRATLVGSLLALLRVCLPSSGSVWTGLSQGSGCSQMSGSSLPALPACCCGPPSAGRRAKLSSVS